LAAVRQQQNNLTYKKRTPKLNATLWQQRPLTANSRHFLRVNAQTLYLDKQKTPQICKTLGVSGGRIPVDKNIDRQC
jgi:hypothetical protein